MLHLLANGFVLCVCLGMDSSNTCSFHVTMIAQLTQAQEPQAARDSNLRFQVFMLAGMRLIFRNSVLLMTIMPQMPRKQPLFALVRK